MPSPLLSYLACFSFLTLLSLFSACEPDSEQNFTIKGLRPIYMSSDQWQKITLEPPRSITHLGKLATKDGYLFVNERMQGIHIIDNRNPAEPITIGFISIPGNTDFDFRGEILYADNFSDLVALRWVNTAQIEISHRSQGLYTSDIPAYPANHEGYFECADPSKGFVVDWVEADLVNPKCRR